MIKYKGKPRLLIDGIVSRLSSDGILRKQLEQSKELLKKYPSSDYASSIFDFFRKKIWFGKVKYSKLYHEAWSKLNENTEIDLFSIGPFKFITDSVFAFDFTGIFLCERYQSKVNYNLDIDKAIALDVLSIVGTTEGSYTSKNVIIEIDDVVIDAGANMGLFTVFSAYHGAKYIYAFEPQPKVVEILNKNIELNSIKSKVEVIQMGLNDKDESIKLNLNSDFHAAASIVMSLDEGEFETIKCVSLDNWTVDNKVTKIDFIKADIEGAERLLLKGAKNVLRNLAPKLAICTYHLPDDKEVLTNLILEANPNYIITYTSHKLFAHVPKMV